MKSPRTHRRRGRTEKRKRGKKEDVHALSGGKKGRQSHGRVLKKKGRTVRVGLSRERSATAGGDADNLRLGTTNQKILNDAYGGGESARKREKRRQGLSKRRGHRLG